MEKFCFFCVTYSRDYEAFVSMIESFKKYNVDKIPFVVALQDESVYGGGRKKIAKSILINARHLKMIV